MTDMRVWVGCLGCYNAGALVGTWVDAIEANTVTIESLAASITDDQLKADHLGRTIYGPHEELWCLDAEGLEPFIEGECSPMSAQALAEQLDGLEDHELETLRVYVDGVGVQSLGRVDDWADVAADAIDKFTGRAESLAAWAEEFVEETGVLTEMTVQRDQWGGRINTRAYEDSTASIILRNVDWDGVAQELSDGMTVVNHDGEVWLFSA